MPTVLRIGPYRFFFYSSDGTEPRHVHVDRDDAEAKYWLDPIRLERSKGFSRSELRTLLRHVEDNIDSLRESWDEFFSN